MSEYNKVGLYNHNAKSYDKIKEGFTNDNVVAIVHATGTGKSFNAIQYAYDNKDKKIIYVVPYKPIIEHLQQIIKDNPNLSMDDFNHVEFRTYSSFVNMDYDELKDLDVDTLILDEFHHIGAPVWGKQIKKIIETHPNIKVLGMTAYTVRDRGTSYETDMVNSETDEVFSNKVVSTYDLCDAFIDGVLPKPVYKSAYINLENTIESLEKRINSLNPDTENYRILSKLMKDIKQRIHEAPSLAEVFKNNIKKNGKYIYFCPLISEQGVNDIETIQAETKKWLREMGLSEDDYILYTTTSEMGEEGKKNRDAFYNDLDLEGNKANNKLKIMYAINQYNEGTHVPSIDGVIMGRTTQSDIVFFEQLGRALAVRGKTKENFDLLNSKPIEELKQICKDRNIDLKDSYTKEDIIELLLAPTIIDLANNIEFIKNLEDNLKDRVKLMQQDYSTGTREVHLRNANFDVEMLNQDLFEIVKYMYDRLTMTWEDKYELAKAYYEHHGDLEIPQHFKTINGYKYDENGISLGNWISIQRRCYKGVAGYNIPPERIELLNAIGMRWDLMENWMKYYNLAKAYYEEHHNLEIPYDYKTTNGYEYDDNGIALGHWISRQRGAYNGHGTTKINSDRIKLLNLIGMHWDLMENWMKYYNLAKAYYEEHHNLEIPYNFKTTNGYEYDEQGEKLGSWIIGQRDAIKGKNGRRMLTSEQIELLNAIGMRWENIDLMENWMKYYNLAKAYYEHYHDLEISIDFKTTNGYEYNENGMTLGQWISTQRTAYKGHGRHKIDSNRIELLNAIGMRWENIDLMGRWLKTYKLAKSYYEKKHNLEVPYKFKTTNGYEYDENGINLGEWIHTQRKAFNNKGKHKITPEQIDLLNAIGMRWDNLYMMDEWMKNYNLAKAYYEHYHDLEVPIRFKTKNGYEKAEDGFSLGKWITRQRGLIKVNKKNATILKQIELLNAIGMRWENIDLMDNWMEKYELAKVYYERYGNLEIPFDFETTNGYERNESGIKLGDWVNNQRKAYNNNRMSQERIELLNAIGMRWKNLPKKSK